MGAAALVVSSALGLAGCATPSEPPAPPGGGTPLQLSFDDFSTQVAPLMTQHGCDAGGDCHGGGIRGTFELSPAGAKDLDFDFAQVALQVSGHSPPSSPILTEPLAVTAGGTPHSVKPFPDTAHPDYQLILGWIEDGVTP